MFATFSLVTLVLSAAGLHAVALQSVTLRTQQIGFRVAPGVGQLVQTKLTGPTTLISIVTIPISVEVLTCLWTRRLEPMGARCHE